MSAQTRDKARGCATPGCDRPHAAKGWCNPCYQRNKTAGTLGANTGRVSMDWMKDAACIGLRNFTERPHDARKATCDTCPVLKVCRAADPWEWWGAKKPAPSRNPAPGECRNGHTLAELGRDERGRCVACVADQRVRHAANKRAKRQEAAA